MGAADPGKPSLSPASPSSARDFPRLGNFRRVSRSRCIQNKAERGSLDTISSNPRRQHGKLAPSNCNCEAPEFLEQCGSPDANIEIRYCDEPGVFAMPTNPFKFLACITVDWNVIGAGNDVIYLL